MRIKYIICAFLFISFLYSCREEEEILLPQETKVTEGVKSPRVKGMFLLNEGNMGSNKATLDYFDFERGVYTKNIYAYRNPGVVKELGDVGNDLQIYGDKLYAVINCSHFVEVMNVNTAEHITQISIPNCRYITFDQGYAYVSSYAGPVKIDPNARLGYVAKIDTTNMAVVDTCVVGYQPEEIAIVGKKLYVANSGGYRKPNYDNRISVIDLTTFETIKEIEVAPNLHRLQKDAYGRLYVSSRGNYQDVPSSTFVIDTQKDELIADLQLPSSDMVMDGDSLYVYSAEWSDRQQANTLSYAIFNVKEQKVISKSLVGENQYLDIQMPYGMAIHPDTHELFLTDAKDYVTPGKLHCFARGGRHKWSVTTGDIPAHIVFTTKRLQPKR